MTRRDYSNLKGADDDYDRKIECLVDRRNISYDMARQIVGARLTEMPPDVLVGPPRTSTKPYYGPFDEPATRILDDIGRAEYRSQLAMRKVAPLLARLVVAKVISQYEQNALFAARRNRDEELTYKGPDSPEEDLSEFRNT